MNWFAALIQSFAKGLKALAPDCRQVVRLQSEAMDHDLSRGQRFGMRLHLLFCKWCRRYGRQIAFLRLASRRSAEAEQTPPPASLSPAARERIRQRLSSEEE